MVLRFRLEKLSLSLSVKSVPDCGNKVGQIELGEIKERRQIIFLLI